MLILTLAPGSLQVAEDARVPATVHTESRSDLVTRMLDGWIARGNLKGAYDCLLRAEPVRAAHWQRMAAVLEAAGEPKLARRASRRAERLSKECEQLAADIRSTMAPSDWDQRSTVLSLFELADSDPARAIPLLEAAASAPDLERPWAAASIDLALATARFEMGDATSARSTLERIVRDTDVCEPGGGVWAPGYVLAAMGYGGRSLRQERQGPFPELRLLGRIDPQEALRIIESRLAAGDNYAPYLKTELAVIQLWGGNDEVGFELLGEPQVEVEIAWLPRRTWARAARPVLSGDSLPRLHRLADQVVLAGEWDLAEGVYDSLFRLVEEGGLNGFPFPLHRTLLEARPRFLLDHLRAIEALNSKNHDVHQDVGDLYWRLGRAEQAIAAWKRALALDPQDEIAQNRLDVVESGGPLWLPD